MKNFGLKLVVALVVAAAVWSCEKESLKPSAEGAGVDPVIVAELGGRTSGATCGDPVTYALVDGLANTEVQYCGFLPCTGAQPAWGSVDLSNSASDLFLDVSVAFSWYIQSVEVFLGSETDLQLNNCVPEPDASWDVEVLGANVSSYQGQVSLDGLTGCVDLSIRVVAYKLDFFSGVDVNSITELWVSNPDWNNPAEPQENSNCQFVPKYCIGSCGPVVSSVTGGECRRCDAEVTVDFYDCDSVEISSCKDLSNVVLAYVDGSWEKFDGLSGLTGGFSGTGSHAGKEISHVYVKSGCFKSGEGPGFGRRFDGPCLVP